MLNVMVVEDERLVANDLRARLIELGYRVPCVACSGQEALNYAAKAHLDLALMDIRLKGELDGIETAAQLDAFYNVPVVFLTAHADDVTVRRASRVCPFGYLVKPINDADLKATLDVAKQKSRADLMVRQRDQRFASELQELMEHALLPVK